MGNETNQLIEKIKAVVSSTRDLLSKLEEREDFLKEFDIDISNSKKDEIRKAIKDLEYYKDKLEKDIIEVAFVGLEKAGKSTLINAIISKDILPSDNKRATYTITRVEYDENQRVEVTFYNEEELNNEVFRRLLKEIGYPNYERHTIDTIEKDDIEMYFKKLKKENPNLYSKHADTTKNDILEILEGKKEIKKLLGRGKLTKTFENLDAETRSYITDKHKSRAVKEVRIYTNALKDIKNVIILDMPGFDSPTVIHSKFTKSKIDQADAVVFVKEAVKPSINRSEAEIIREARDDEGVALKDKVFYFCNKSDMFRSKEELEKVKKDFKQELERYNILKNDSRVDRIIYGSSLAELQKKGVYEGEEAYKKLQELGFADTGIQTLLDRIKEYNQTERKEVLLERIHRRFRKVEYFVKELQEKLERIDIEEIPMDTYTENILDTIRQSRELIEKGLNEFHIKKKHELDNGNISEEIKKELDRILASGELLSEDRVEGIKKKLALHTSTKEERPDAFNRELRKELSDIIRKRIYSTVQKHIELDLKKVREDIEKIFLEGFRMNEIKEPFLEELRELLRKNNVDFSPEKFDFTKLIERFGGDVIQLLILNPLASQDRENKFKEIEKEFYSLIAYHKDFNPEEPPAKMRIVNVLLWHEDDFAQIEERFKKVLEKKDIQLSREEFEECKKLILKSSDAEELLNKLETNKYLDSDNVKTVIEQYIKSEAIKEKKKERKIEPPKNYDEVIQEIKRDIDNLRNFLIDCVVNAINIEKLVVNQLTSYINMIVSLIKSRDFEDFVRRNMKHIRPEIYREVGKRAEESRFLKELRQKVKAVINSLEGRYEYKSS